MAKKQLLEDTTHAFQDNTMRFSLDALLRSNGFQIHARRKRLDPIWEKKGLLYSQHQALRTVREGDVADAQYLEEIHYKNPAA